MLEKLRMDPATYTVDPMTTIADNDVVGLERYKYFLQTFNMAEYQQRISRLLNEFPELKALMNKLGMCLLDRTNVLTYCCYYTVLTNNVMSKKKNSSSRRC